MTQQIIQKTENKPSTLKEWLASDSFKEQIRIALPKHLTPERFIRIATTTLMRVPKLGQCSQESVFKCLLDLSSLGLEPDGRRAHLIPFDNRKTGKTECQLIVDYKGIVELVRRSGEVSYIHADVVCDNDVFEVAFGTGGHLIHKPAFRDRGKVYAAYSYIKLKDESEDFDMMSLDEINAIRARSKAKDSGPWVTDWNEMAKKGLALDTPIPTPDGWTTMCEIDVGDEVFDMDGNITRVIAISEIKNLPCFRVNFSCGDSIICDDEHRWLARCGGANANKHPFKVQTVNEIFDSLNDGLSATIPMQSPLNTDETVLPIEPYLLGYWLGDGNSYSAAITCGKEDLEHVIEMVKKSKYTLGKLYEDKRTGAYTVRIKNGMLEDLRDLGVLQNKHVPKQYLRSSIKQRKSILQGLMDSDGHIDKARGRAYFYNNNKKISDAVFELVCSLGDVPHQITKRQRGFGTECITHFVGWKPSFCCVRLDRKMENYQLRKIDAYRAIKSIEEIDSVPTKCIAVDSQTKTYLAGKSMAITHNTVFRRHSKWLPLSSELQEKIEKDDEPLTEQERFVVAKPVFSSPVLDAPTPKRPRKNAIGESSQPEKFNSELDEGTPIPEAENEATDLSVNLIAKLEQRNMVPIEFENFLKRVKKMLDPVYSLHDAPASKLNQILENFEMLADEFEGSGK